MSLPLTTTYNFETSHNWRALHSSKWSYFPEDVLPMWVADMDFTSPPAVVQALTERVAAGYFAYTLDYPPLKEAVVERMARLYAWHISPEDVLLIPGMVVALNLVARAIGKPGDAILSETPVYGPFLSVPRHNAKFARTVDLRYVPLEGQAFTYRTDWDALEAAFSPQTSLYFLCNPHNPGGFCYARADLERLAALCLKHKTVICADEIHSDLLLDPQAQHIPIATLSPEVAQNTITLIAPSKTYNLPSLGCSIAIIPNPELRRAVAEVMQGMGLHVNVLGAVAGEAAYRSGDDWLKAVLTYLRANRDHLVDFVLQHLPQLRITVPQATYLAWLDCRNLAIDGDAHSVFLKRARVAVNPGTFFGSAGTGFVRLNFACSRATLDEALERLRAALA
ncbi:MAG: PatB family C-S lyase [Anaerolineae bacterium]|nr:PatB family C-S lyase [Anaerolineae bacterium]MDW8172172.1 PatB family C-S lyase [Anaerolineae bacterium]